MRINASEWLGRNAIVYGNGGYAIGSGEIIGIGTDHIEMLDGHCVTVGIAAKDIVRIKELFTDKEMTIAFYNGDRSRFTFTYKRNGNYDVTHTNGGMHIGTITVGL
jgi:hypothetical protein